MLHPGPSGDLLCSCCRDIAEEEVGDVSLKDDDLAVAREDAGKHTNGALQDRDDRKHGGDAEGDAGHADDRPDAVTAEIRQDQLEKDHADPRMVVSRRFA